MSYIRKVVGSNERLVLLTRLHWIYLFEAFFWFVAITAVGLLIDHYLWFYAGSKIGHYTIDMYFIAFNEKSTPIPYAFAFCGLAVFWSLFSAYISTEIGLTDRRIIHKKGLFMIEVQQVELEDIRGEQVSHGWLGWLLGYGRINFDCRFIDNIYLPATRDPYRIVKAVHTARMRHENITYGVDDLEKDIEHLNQRRIEAFKAREKIKRAAIAMKAALNTKLKRQKRS